MSSLKALILSVMDASVEGISTRKGLDVSKPLRGTTYSCLVVDGRYEYVRHPGRG